jgi:Lon protease-like protein
MHDGVAIDWSRPIPLFPLQDCVLLPHATIPLHIFEPRYRAMMADVLDSHGLIAMAVFEGERWRTEYEGKPPLRACVCPGMVVRHERLSDGRYNLLLQGLARAKVTRELTHDPYRLAMLAPIEPAAPMEIDLTEPRRQIERLLADPMLRQLECISAIQHWLSHEIPTAVLIDLAIMTCSSSSEHRYAMLAEADAAARGAWVVNLLRERRESLIAAAHEQPPVSEDGLGLN